MTFGFLLVIVIFFFFQALSNTLIHSADSARDTAILLGHSQAVSERYSQTSVQVQSCKRLLDSASEDDEANNEAVDAVGIESVVFIAASDTLTFNVNSYGIAD